MATDPSQNPPEEDNAESYRKAMFASYGGAPSKPATASVTTSPTSPQPYSRYDAQRASFATASSPPPPPQTTASVTTSPTSAQQPSQYASQMATYAPAAPSSPSPSTAASAPPAPGTPAPAYTPPDRTVGAQKAAPGQTTVDGRPLVGEKFNAANTSMYGSPTDQNRPVLTRDGYIRPAPGYGVEQPPNWPNRSEGLAGEAYTDRQRTEGAIQGMQGLADSAEAQYASYQGHQAPQVDPSLAKSPTVTPTSRESFGSITPTKQVNFDPLATEGGQTEGVGTGPRAGQVGIPQSIDGAKVGDYQRAMAAQMATGQIGADQNRSTKLMSSLQGAIDGTAPSVAQSQLTSTLEQEQAAQMAATASSYGGNNALVARHAMDQMALQQGKTGQDMATLRANETATARGQMGSVISDTRNADQSLSSTQAGLDQQGMLANVGNSYGKAVQDATFGQNANLANQSTNLAARTTDAGLQTQAEITRANLERSRLAHDADMGVTVGHNNAAATDERGNLKGNLDQQGNLLDSAHDFTGQQDVYDTGSKDDLTDSQHLFDQGQNDTGRSVAIGTTNAGLQSHTNDATDAYKQFLGNMGAQTYQSAMSAYGQQQQTDWTNYWNGEGNNQAKAQTAWDHAQQAIGSGAKVASALGAFS